MARSRKAIAEGKLIHLRTPVIADAPEYSALCRKSRDLYRNLADPPRTPGKFAEYVMRCERDDYLGLLICRNEDQAIVGMINLSQIVRGNFQNACIGYSIGEPFARKGYMTEAMQLALRLAFDELNLHRVEANIQPGNTASIALVRRAGFRKEGFSERYLKLCGSWRDHERWAILAENWRVQQSASHANTR